jgi:spore germination protein KC/spore germination protein
MEVEPDFEKLSSTELWRLVKGQRITSEAPIVTEFEFVSKLLSKVTSPIAPLVTVTDEQGEKAVRRGNRRF